MRKLLFLSRVGFLCNLCFLITWGLRYVPLLSNGIIPSTLLILGHVLAIVINTLLTILYIAVALTGKSFRGFVPGWLIITNFVIFVLQIILLIK